MSDNKKKKRRVIRLIITGNPGVGKHTISQIIAKEFEAQIIDINKVVLEAGNDDDNNDTIIPKTKTHKGIEADPKKTGKVISSMLKKAKGSVIIVGHLAPYVVKPTEKIDMVAVLRRSPLRLEETLLSRKYTRDKVNENVSAEILGITLYDCIEAFGIRKVAEFDTTGKTPDQTAEDIISTIQKKKKRRQPGSIDWLAVVSEEEIQRFFAYQ